MISFHPFSVTGDSAAGREELIPSGITLITDFGDDARCLDS